MNKQPNPTLAPYRTKQVTAYLVALSRLGAAARKGKPSLNLTPEHQRAAAKARWAKWRAARAMKGFNKFGDKAVDERSES